MRKYPKNGKNAKFCKITNTHQENPLKRAKIPKKTKKCEKAPKYQKNGKTAQFRKIPPKPNITYPAPQKGRKSAESPVTTGKTAQKRPTHSPTPHSASSKSVHGKRARPRPPELNAQCSMSRIRPKSRASEKAKGGPSARNTPRPTKTPT